MCYACGESGNVAKLASYTGGAIEKVAGLSISLELKKSQDQEWRKYLQSPLAIDNKYLKSRKVGNDLVKRHGILGDDKVIVFPLPDSRGNVSAIQLKVIESGKYIIHGSRPVIWPMDMIPFGDEVMIVEGVFGALRLLSAGICAYATLSAGSAKKAAKTLSSIANSYIWFDHDEAGYVGAAKLSKAANIPVIVPGAEVDELPIEKLRKLKGSFKNLDMAYNWKHLSQFVPENFYKKVGR